MWHAIVEVRLSNSFDLNSPRLGPLKSDQVSHQRTLSASRSAEYAKDSPPFDLKGNVLHENLSPPTNAQIVDGDVRSLKWHVQMPIRAKKNVKNALITITERMD
jgi:hypothetical protein